MLHFLRSRNREKSNLIVASEECQFKRQCEHEAAILRKQYQSMTDEFKNDVSFDTFLNCAVIHDPGKLAMVNYIKKMIKEEVEIAMVEESRKEEAKGSVCGLQPTSKQIEEKNQSISVEEDTSKVHILVQNESGLDEDTLASEEIKLESQNTSLDLHGMGNNEDYYGKKIITAVLSPNKDSSNEDLETNGFSKDAGGTVVWDKYVEEEQDEANTNGVFEPAYDHYESEVVDGDSDVFLSPLVEDLVKDNSLLYAEPIPYEELLTSVQEDFFGMYVGTNDKISNTSTQDNFIEEKNDKIFKATSFDDSLIRYNANDLGGSGFDYQTTSVEKVIDEDFSSSGLRSDSFKESTVQEEHDDLFPIDHCNQTFHIWDPGAMSPRYDKEPEWDKFPFDPDEVQKSVCNASNEVIFGGEVAAMANENVISYVEEKNVLKSANDLDAFQNYAQEEYENLKGQDRGTNLFEEVVDKPSIQEICSDKIRKEADFENHVKENKSEKLMFDEHSFFADWDQGPKELQVLKDNLLVSEEKIVKVLLKFDNTYHFIAELCWKFQFEEKLNGVKDGDSLSHFFTKRSKDQVHCWQERYPGCPRDREAGISSISFKG